MGTPIQTHAVTKVLETTGYQHIQMLTWYKFDQQLAGPVFRMTSATEVALVAYWGNVKQDARGMFNMPTNPTSRHNVVLGPGKRVLSKNTLGQATNVHEKPDYLSEYIINWFSNMDAWIMVAGFGAGGDLRGILNASRNVVGIENDPKQYAATTGILRNYAPKSDLSMVLTYEQLSFVSRNFERLKTYDKMEGTENECYQCSTTHPGDGHQCQTCGSIVCLNCHPTSASACKDCLKAGLGVVAAVSGNDLEAEEGKTSPVEGEAEALEGGSA